MATDPVCGMQVNEQSASGTAEYEGKTFYFCSPGCKVAFEKNPLKYLGPQEDHDGHEHHGHHHN